MVRRRITPFFHATRTWRTALEVARKSPRETLTTRGLIRKGVSYHYAKKAVGLLRGEERFAFIHKRSESGQIALDERNELVRKTLHHALAEKPAILSIQELARETGLSEKTVEEHINFLKDNPRALERFESEAVMGDLQELIDLVLLKSYLTEDPLIKNETIADRLDIDKNSLYYRLKRLEEFHPELFERKRAIRTKVDERNALVWRLLREGKTTAEIANALGTDSKDTARIVYQLKLIEVARAVRIGKKPKEIARELDLNELEVRRFIATHERVLATRKAENAEGRK